jgi:hypothetical protein
VYVCVCVCVCVRIRVIRAEVIEENVGVLCACFIVVLSLMITCVLEPQPAQDSKDESFAGCSNSPLHCCAAT